jgi:hypothetical protein
MKELIIKAELQCEQLKQRIDEYGINPWSHIMNVLEVDSYVWDTIEVTNRQYKSRNAELQAQLEDVKHEHQQQVVC